MKMQPEVQPRLQRRDRAAAAQDRPEGHGGRARAGHAAARARLHEGGAIPVEPDAAGRQPRRDPRGARRRHARLPDDPAQRRRPRGCAATARALARGDPALRARPRATAARCSARSPTRKQQHQARRSTTSSLVDGRARRQATTRWPSSSRTRTRVFATLASQDANLRASLQRAADRAPGDADARSARRTRSPTSSARRCRRCGPARARSGPTLRSVRPFVRGDDAGHPRRDPPVRARRRGRRSRSCGRRCKRPRDGDARPHAHVQGRQLPARRARLQPAGPGGGLPVLGRLGRTTSATTIFTTQDAHGPIRRGLFIAGCQDARPCSSRSRQANPLLGTLTDLLNLPTPGRARQSTPGTPGSRRRADARCRSRPLLRSHRRHGRRSRCPASACCCSCGSRSAAPIPLKPKGYRFTASFSEATQLAQEADVRISGVPVGKVKTIEPASRPGAPTSSIELDAALRAAAARRAGDPAPEDAAGRDLRRADAGQPDRQERSPRAGALPASQVSPTVELDEIFRAFDAKTRDAFQVWMQTQAQAIDGRGRDVNDALGNLGPFAEDASELRRHPQPPAGRRAAADLQHRRRVRRADRARRPAARADRELRPRCSRRPRARDRELQQTFVRAADVRARVARRRCGGSTAFADNTNPLVTQLRPAARELSPTLQRPGDARAGRSRRCSRDLDKLITASKTGFPAARADAPRPAAAAAARPTRRCAS